MIIEFALESVGENLTMLIVNDLRDHVMKRPFAPFRIHMSDDHSLDIRHPDICILGRNKLFVGIPDPRAKDVAVRVTECAIMHITRIEPLNGKRNGHSPNEKRRRG